MNSNSFFSSIYDDVDNELDGREDGSGHLPDDTTNNFVDSFSMQQRYPLNNRATFTPGRSITRRATINTASRWLQNDEQQVYNSSYMMEDIDNNRNISTINNGSSSLLELDDDLFLGVGNRMQAQHNYQQQLYLEREHRLLGERNMVSQSRLPLGRRPQSNHEPHSAQQQRRQDLMQNQYLGSDHSTLTNERTISNSTHNYADSSIPPEYPLAFTQDASDVNTFRNSSSRHENFIMSPSLNTQFPLTHDSEIDDSFDFKHPETSRSLHDIYTAGPRVGHLPTSSFHNESVRSFSSINDGTGHGSSQHYTYNRREPSSSSLNVVSFHSNASNNIGTGTGPSFTNRRQFAPYPHQQQQGGLFFGTNKISDHENLYTMDASCHSISSFHSELNQLDVSQSDPIEALHINDSSPSLHQRRNSSFRRFGPRTMQMSSNHSDHSSMAQISRHSTGVEGINATQLGHLRQNFPHEDTVRRPAQDSRKHGDISTQAFDWNQNNRSQGVRHLVNPPEQASSNTQPQLPQQQHWPLPSNLTKSASFSQHTKCQSESNSTILPSSDHAHNRNRTQSACGRIFSIFTKDSVVSPAPTSQSSRTSITTASVPESPTNELDLNRRKRGRTKSNQNIEFMRRVPFRAPSLITQQNNVPNAQQQDAPTDATTVTDIIINNNDNEKDDQEAPDRLEVNSLLHKACKFYPETRVVIESALQLDIDAIRRPVPVTCVGTTTARRNSLGYVGPEILTCIQLMKGVTIDESRDKDDATTLKQSVDCYSYPINIALMSGAQLDVIEMLANAGSDVLIQPDGPEEANSLGIAVAHGCDIDVIRLLLITNIDTAQGCDRHYNLPLHVAVRSGTISNEILTTIHNAYPEAIGIKNFHGLNPLDVAIHSPLCTDSTVDLLQEMFNISLEADDVKFGDEQDYEHSITSGLGFSLRSS